MARALRVPINEADQHRLMTIAGVDERRAALLVRWRMEHGPFRTWRDVEEVPGIDAAILERLQEAVTLGAPARPEVPGAAPQIAEDAVGTPREEESGDFDEALDDAELDALLAVAQLDLEAAHAFDLASDTVDDPTLRAMLLRFAGEHRRHVERIQCWRSA